MAERAAVIAEEIADAFAEEWRRWYREAESALTEPYGFLAMTGLTWLGPEAVEVPGVPGRWRTDDGGVVVDLAPGESLRLGTDPGTGEEITGRLVVPTEDGGPRVWHGRVLVEVVHRPEGVFVRPRDPDNPRRTRFAGTLSFKPDPRWRLQGVVGTERV